MKAQDMAESAIKAIDRGQPEEARRIFGESVAVHGHQWTCGVFVDRISLEAARAMDVRHYGLVRQLFELLCECTPPHLDRRYIERRFSAEGAGLELVPPGDGARGISQLVTARAWKVPLGTYDRN